MKPQRQRIREAVEEVFKECPTVVKDAKTKKSAFSFLIGKSLIKLEGVGDLSLLVAEIKEQLGGKSEP